MAGTSGRGRVGVAQRDVRAVLAGVRGRSPATRRGAPRRAGSPRRRPSRPGAADAAADQCEGQDERQHPTGSGGANQAFGSCDVLRGDGTGVPANDRWPRRCVNCAAARVGLEGDHPERREARRRHTRLGRDPRRPVQGRRVDVHGDRRPGRQRAAGGGQDVRRPSSPARPRWWPSRRTRGPTPATRSSCSSPRSRARSPATRATRAATAARRTSGPWWRRSASSPPAPWSRSGTASPSSSPSPTSASFTINYVVLGIAFLLEGTSFFQASRQVHGASRRWGMHPLQLRRRHLQPDPAGGLLRGLRRAARPGPGRRRHRPAPAHRPGRTGTPSGRWPSACCWPSWRSS